MRALENQLKSLGEEPNSRAKKSSSGSDSEVEWQSGQESKLKEVEASLQLEREQRKQIEKQLCELRANSAKVNTEVQCKKYIIIYILYIIHNHWALFTLLTVVVYVQSKPVKCSCQ